MVREYMATRIDLTRASMTPSVAIATDFLHEWLKELQKELLPEGTRLQKQLLCVAPFHVRGRTRLKLMKLYHVLHNTVLEEMVVEYFDQKQSDELYDVELHEMLRSVAVEAMAESIWEAHVRDELTPVSIDAFIELKLNEMVSSIAASGSV